MPIELFDIFLPSDSIEMLCENTNDKALRSREVQFDDAETAGEPIRKPRPWADVDITQMYGYLGTLVWLGCHKRVRRTKYWSTIKS